MIIINNELFQTRRYPAIVNFIILICLLISASSCGSASVWIKPDVDFRKNADIAIVDFDMREQKTGMNLPEVGRQFRDLLGLYFIRCGFNVLERNKINVILEEMKIQQTGLTSQEDAVALGKMLNAKYIVYGSGLVSFTTSSPFIRSATVKMVKVESGKVELLANWSGSGVHVADVAKRIGEKIENETQELNLRTGM